jgi:alkylhydroperoxidase/carboxymuconolactone decarboxylase family protein YurZ
MDVPVPRELAQDEIGEVLLQTAVYCGIAVAEDNFRMAQAFTERGI